MTITRTDESTALNIATHRTPVSVWDRRGWDGTHERLTLPRLLLGVGASVLVIQGLRQRNVAGSLLAGFGASLACWAMTGDEEIAKVRRWFLGLLERATWPEDDLIHAASADSFPASDAPAWTPTVGAGLRRRRQGSSTTH